MKTEEAKSLLKRRETITSVKLLEQLQVRLVAKLERKQTLLLEIKLRALLQREAQVLQATVLDFNQTSPQDALPLLAAPRAAQLNKVPIQDVNQVLLQEVLQETHKENHLEQRLRAASKTSQIKKRKTTHSLTKMTTFLKLKR